MTLESKIKLVFGAQCSLDGTSVTFPSNESLADFIDEYDRFKRDLDRLQKDKLVDNCGFRSNVDPNIEYMNEPPSEKYRF